MDRFSYFFQNDFPLFTDFSLQKMTWKAHISTFFIALCHVALPPRNIFFTRPLANPITTISIWSSKLCVKECCFNAHSRPIFWVDHSKPRVESVHHGNESNETWSNLSLNGANFKHSHKTKLLSSIEGVSVILREITRVVKKPLWWHRTEIHNRQNHDRPTTLAIIT